MFSFVILLQLLQLFVETDKLAEKRLIHALNKHLDNRIILINNQKSEKITI